MKHIFLLAIATALSFVSASYAQNRYYVNASASGANTGASWTDAFNDLQLALQVADAGDEVWVSEGVYYPTGTMDRSISFEPKSGVKLYGGFAGDESSINERDWTMHITMLSGDIGIPGDSTDNSRNVMYLFQPDSNTVVDGFTLCFGLADDEPSANSSRDRAICGAGLYIEAGNWDALANILNCRFWRNSALSYGGGVMLNGASVAGVAPRFLHCFFEGNNSMGSGGGVARFGGSWKEHGKEFEACHFLYNRAAQNGGGLYFIDTKGPNSISINSCSFKGNSANIRGGASYFLTGKLGESGLVIQNSTFEINRAIQGAAIAIFSNGNEFVGGTSIDSCSFYRNKANSSGNISAIIYTDQIGVLESVVHLRNLIIEENFSDNDLLFLASVYSTLIIEGVLLKKNEAGGTLITQSDFLSSKLLSSIFQLNKSNLISYQGLIGEGTSQISNCLFEKNKTSSIIGFFGSPSEPNLSVFNAAFLFAIHPIVNSSLISYGFDSLLVFNTIITDTITKWSFSDNSPVFLSHNSFGLIDCNDQSPNVTCGPNNLSGLDPLFRDTANHDYSLLPCSPLINAGSNLAAAGILTDLAGNPRIQDGTVDIGAFESPGFTLASMPQIKPACIGASNGSIRVEPISGCEPYTYNWLPDAGDGPELNGLPPGNYLLSITDGSGRQILDTLTVAEAPNPTLAPVHTDVLCSSGLGGSITAGTAGGTAPFQYQWLPQAPDTATLSQIPPGNYALTVTDVNGCQDSASTSIALQGMITLMIDGQAIPCHGETGWLSATPVTGAAPFQWQWLGWSGTDSLAQPLSPGQYSVTVTDVYGCTASNTFPPMTEPSLITATIGTDPQTDLNMPNGVAVVTSTSGGSPAFPPLPPYQYSWSTGAMEHFILGLEAGAYTVTITDKNGCTAVLEVVVDLMVGTEDPQAQALLLYPNPAMDWLRVVLPEPSSANTLELLDENGRLLRSVALAKGQLYGQLDLLGLPGGTYWVRVMDGKQAIFGKVLKI